MSEITQYTPGTFCWVEAGISDQMSAKSFYAKVFGWDTHDSPLPGGGSYTLLRKNGKDVGGLYQLNPDQKKMGIPPHWLSYVAVASVDEATKKANALGAQTMMGPFDVMTAGRMSVLKDPTGAVFALWQARQHIGSVLVNEPGAPTWNELATSDTRAARAFYTGLFGWSADEQQMGPMKYTVFKNGDRPAGGMYDLPKEWAGVPPHWMVYFAVADCDAIVEQVKGLGGTVMAPPSDIPNVGRFAILQDPQRAAFAVLKLAGPVS